MKMDDETCFTDDEKENYDIGGAYLFKTATSTIPAGTFGEIINPLGAGYHQQYARNRLKIQLWNATTQRQPGNRQAFPSMGQQPGTRPDRRPRIRQFEYQDSAGFIPLPYQPGNLSLFPISQQVGFGYPSRKRICAGQYPLLPMRNSQVTLQAGLRYHYNDLNKEFRGPRIQASWKPSWKQDIVFSAAAGI